MRNCDTIDNTRVYYMQNYSIEKKNTFTWHTNAAVYFL